MNCTECKELFVEYVEGLLDESQKQAISEHLISCRNCKTTFDEFTDIQERLVSNSNKVKNSSIENKVIDRIVREQNVKIKTLGKEDFAPKIRSKIMKSTFVKLAAAAVIVIAVLIGLNPFKTNITFGEVVAPILNAGTIAYDLFLGSENESNQFHDIVVGKIIRRDMPNYAMTMVIDLENKKMLSLTKQNKTAVYLDIQGPIQERTQNYIDFLKKIIQDNKDNYRKLGLLEIDGQKAIGFEAGNANEKALIYANPETALPIRIEITLGKMFAILKNFQFDIPVDASLFSMVVPDGYFVPKAAIDLTGASEDDFLECLRFWAERLNNGVFPDSISSQIAMRQIASLGQKFSQMNITEQEATQMGQSFGKGIIFIQLLETRNEGKYVGAGVKFGDKNRAIFWYKPEGSANYRVIYGDLHVEDVSAVKLPR
jgi:hypothetical protein